MHLDCVHAIEITIAYEGANGGLSDVFGDSSSLKFLASPYLEVWSI